MREGIKNGLVSEERINEAVIRVLATKAALRLHDSTNKYDDNPSIIGCEEHLKLASLCADEAITLVKNTQNIIPLEQGKYKKVLLISLSHEERKISNQYHSIKLFKNLIENKGLEVTLLDQSKYVNGDIEQSINDFVTSYDLVIYSANVKVQSNKTSLRINWSLPSGCDMPWFVKEIPTVFISFSNPYHLMDVPQVTTYINTYGSNESSVEAVVSKLFGESQFKGVDPVNPFSSYCQI